MRELGSYLKHHGRVLFFYGICSGIFILFFFLYQIPVEAALYSAAVCGALGVLLVFPHFLAFRKKRRELQSLYRQQEFSVNNLPEPEGILERDYQELMEEWNRRYRSMEEEHSRKYRDMMEYYTLWVHQIKTPIASMYLNLENEDTALSRAIKGDLMRIEQYVDMVLCYLRLDSEDTDYMFQEYGMDGIVRQALHRFSSSFINGKIRLEYQPVKSRVLTDEKWLLFVIEQVLSNALKYTKSGAGYGLRRQSRGFSVSGIRELVLHQRICPGFLKRDIPDTTADVRKKPVESGCIFAAVFVTAWGTEFGYPPQ